MIKKKKADVRWTEEEISIIMEFFGKIPHKEVLEKLPGRTISTLTNKGARLGLAKKHIDYKLQMTPDTAYYLGWIASDGNLRSSKKSYDIRLAINTSDAAILEQLKDTMKIGSINRAISYVTKKDGSKRTVDTSTYGISNKSLYKQIISLGITERKSKTIKWIKLEDHLYKGFIRGVFDGDGCISWFRGVINNKGNGDKRICGAWHSVFSSASKDFLIGIHSYLKDNGIVVGGSINTNSFCYNLQFAKKDTLSLGSWLYDDGCLRLDRKYDKFQKTLNGIRGP